MTTQSVEVATSADEASVVAVMTLAFANDPITRWSWPDPRVYFEQFPQFVRVFGGKAFGHAGAHRIEGYAAAALWLPPNIHPDEEAMGALMQSTVPKNVQVDMFAVVEQMGRHHPKEPHWYLPLIGVDPPRQGQGHGAALLKYGLAACDRDGTAAYLESTNPRNVPLYQRHGFDILGTIQAGRSPTITPMLRKPRRR
jgi:ribosomal protein S18 acetylase RimI-like enzyme